MLHVAEAVAIRRAQGDNNGDTKHRPNTNMSFALSMQRTLLT